MSGVGSFFRETIRQFAKIALDFAPVRGQSVPVGAARWLRQRIKAPIRYEGQVFLCNNLYIMWNIHKVYGIYT